MAEALFVILIVLGVLGGLFYTLFRRGWMRNGYFTIGASLIIAVGVMILYQAVGAVLTVMTSGLDLENADPHTLLSAQALAQLFVMVGGTFLLIRATDQDVPVTLRLEGVSETPAKLYALAIPIMYMTQIVFGLLTLGWEKIIRYLPFFDKLQALQDQNQELIDKLVQANSVGDFILVLLAIALVPALAEEMFFRGFLQTNIERSGHGRARPYVAIGIASLIFGIVHFSPLQLPGLVGLGLAMGYMSYRTNNLIVGSVGHFFNNALAAVLMITTGSEGLPDEKQMGLPMLIGAFLASAGLLAVTVSVFHRWSEPLTARNYADDEVRRTTAYYEALEHGFGQSLEDRDPSHSDHTQPDSRSDHSHSDHLNQ